MRQRAFRLHDNRRSFTIIEANESLACLDDLTLGDRNVGHHADDLTADVDAIRRQNVAACHDALNEIRANDRVGFNNRPEHKRRTEISCRQDDTQEDRRLNAPVPQETCGRM